MTRNSKNNHNNSVSDSLDFIKQNWLIITGLLIAIPYIKRYLDDQATNNKINDSENQVKEQKSNYQIKKEKALVQNQNPLTQLQKRAKITPRKDIWAASTSLAHDLAVKYRDAGNWYDFTNPKGWTENDESARKTLVYQSGNFYLLEKLYNQVDTNSRNLRNDILEYLDKDELTYLRKYLKI